MHGALGLLDELRPSQSCAHVYQGQDSEAVQVVQAQTTRGRMYVAARSAKDLCEFSNLRIRHEMELCALPMLTLACMADAAMQGNSIHPLAET